jgi:NADPH:quinone reductase-like Zn-dependent oxidoreductase
MAACPCPTDTVLILGTSAVSLFALQFAKAAGARVIATSSSEEKLEKLKLLGADDVINYKAVTDWGQQAKRLTDGRGVDHVIEVGGPGTLTQSIAACRTGGHIALIGVLTGFAGEVSIPALFSNQIRVSGISIGSRADQEDMIRAIAVNRLKPVIDRHFPLQDIAAAFRHYESQQHFGKCAWNSRALPDIAVSRVHSARDPEIARLVHGVKPTILKWTTNS